MGGAGWSRQNPPPPPLPPPPPPSSAPPATRESRSAEPKQPTLAFPAALGVHDEPALAPAGHQRRPALPGLLVGRQRKLHRLAGPRARVVGRDAKADARAPPGLVVGEGGEARVVHSHEGQVLGVEGEGLGGPAGAPLGAGRGGEDEAASVSSGSGGRAAGVAYSAAAAGGGAAASSSSSSAELPLHDPDEPLLRDVVRVQRPRGQGLDPQGRLAPGAARGRAHGELDLGARRDERGNVARLLLLLVPFLAPVGLLLLLLLLLLFSVLSICNDLADVEEDLVAEIGGAVLFLGKRGSERRGGLSFSVLLFLFSPSPSFSPSSTP